MTLHFGMSYIIYSILEYVKHFMPFWNKIIKKVVAIYAMVSFGV